MRVTREEFKQLLKTPEFVRFGKSSVGYVGVLLNFKVVVTE